MLDAMVNSIEASTLKKQLLPTQLGMMLTFLLAPLWLKWSFAPAPFTSYYVLGFVITTIMVLTIVSWTLTGCIGSARLFRTGWHVGFIICGTLLALWVTFSQYWAFGLRDYPGMAQTSALQLLIVLLFVGVIIATSPSPRIILGILIFSMLLHGFIGGLQVVYQSDIGLHWLGEFSLNPSESGVSVLESEGTRWLRPYGLSPHPNVLAGTVVIGLFGAASWFMQTTRYRLLALVVFLSGFWCLLLSFSRGAWLGFVAGVAFAFVFIGRKKIIGQRLILIVIGAVVVGLIFVVIYYPFLLSRAGISEQNTEMRSISDRLVFLDIAWIAIKEHPIRGIGMGNFPWYASNYIFFNTDFDLRGNNVHNIYLTVWSELGTVGLLLFIGMLICGIGAALHKLTFERLALLSSFVAWSVMGIFDHFMWTLVMSQAIWLGILGAAMSETTDDMLPPVES